MLRVKNVALKMLSYMVDIVVLEVIFLKGLILFRII